MKNNSLEEILYQGLKENRRDKVLIAIQKGVNINFPTRSIALSFLNLYLRLFPLSLQNESKDIKVDPQLVKIFIFLYDKILPEVVKTVQDKSFLQIIYKKLLDYKNIPGISDVYKKWGEFYKNLSEL